MEWLQKLVGEERTMIFHEAPHRLAATLADLESVFGDRAITLCREITKLHEETFRTTLSEAAKHYQENQPKGEFVLVLAGAEAKEEMVVTMEEGVELVLRRREEGMRMKDAVRQVAADTGLNKNDLYAAVLEK